MRAYYAKTSGSLESLEGGDDKYVIWGDWLDVEEDESSPRHYVVNWKIWDRATDRIGVEKCRVEKSDCREEALLEMIFLDVGQGDGCIVNVPDGNGQRTIIVDAGEEDNTYAFLKWRFRYVDENARFEAAIITHPDQDHYKGFQPIFSDPRISFRNVFHNGLVERVAAKRDILGERRDGLCVELYETRDKLEAFLSDDRVRGRKRYPRLLWTALSAPERFDDVAMASVRTGEQHEGRTYLPGFAPRPGRAATIEILGPIPEETADGRLALREFGQKPRDGEFDVGKTKNGHSIILRLNYGGLNVIFGGDLNRPSEDYLLRHYGEIDDEADLADAVEKARERLGADILKCCHHGSADVTDEFLDAVNPFAIVVSSGDEESHVHPRPEILGLLGKKGRGERPILLCTEILRSSPESLKLRKWENEEHDRLLRAVADAEGRDALDEARKGVEKFWQRKLKRLVSVYGAVNIRTDGEKLIVAFRKERDASGSPWHVYEYRLVEGAWAVSAELKPGH